MTALARSFVLLVAQHDAGTEAALVAFGLAILVVGIF